MWWETSWPNQMKTNKQINKIWFFPPFRTICVNHQIIAICTKRQRVNWIFAKLFISYFYLSSWDIKRLMVRNKCAIGCDKNERKSSTEKNGKSLIDPLKNIWMSPPSPPQPLLLTTNHINVTHIHKHTSKSQAKRSIHHSNRWQTLWMVWYIRTVIDGAHLLLLLPLLIGVVFFLLLRKGLANIEGTFFSWPFTYMGNKVLDHPSFQSDRDRPLRFTEKSDFFL